MQKTHLTSRGGLLFGQSLSCHLYWDGHHQGWAAREGLALIESACLLVTSLHVNPEDPRVGGQLEPLAAEPQRTPPSRIPTDG